MTPRPDEELMIAVREGEVHRLAELFERHHRRLYRFCLRMSGAPALAEDLVQEVFMKMLRSRHTFRNGSRFEPWMFQVARNACADHFRRRRPEDELSDDPEVVEKTTAEATAPAEVELREDVFRLRRALERLPADRRELLVLARFEARAYDEIAQLLDCSVGAVKVRVHRAVKQLRQEYQALEQESPS
jgi:RNA polymerase sigma-70 factor (ECF subfamily)